MRENQETFLVVIVDQKGRKRRNVRRLDDERKVMSGL